MGKPVPSGKIAATVMVLLCASSNALADFCPNAGTVAPTSSLATGDAPLTVRVCDLNADGAPDLVTANDASDTISVLINNGDGTYAPAVRWSVDLNNSGSVAEPVAVVCCDINNDKIIDIIAVNHTSDDMSVLVGDGSLGFSLLGRFPVGEAPFGIECLDLDGDSDNDLVANGFTADAISVLLNDGSGNFAAHVPYPTGDATIAMARCDVDGDGDDDIVTANLTDKTIAVMRNNSDGTFTNIGTADICLTPQDCTNPFDVVCCDLDGVNGPDIATANGINDTVTVLFNDGTGSFGGIVSYGTFDGAFALTCCDLDGDGDADLISGNLASDDLGVLLNDGSGTFAAPTFLTVGIDSNANPSSVVCADFDGDGDMDIATAFDDGVTVFANDCPTTCGDGVVDSGEDCDDSGESATCDANCTFVECGDNTLNTSAGEQCDDGANNSDTTPDACRTDCSDPTCGDGVVDTGEQCDDGTNNSDTIPDACRMDCSDPACGDGVVDTGEQCDGTDDAACPGLCLAGCFCSSGEAPDPPQPGPNAHGRTLEILFPALSGGSASSVAAATAFRVTLVSLYNPADPQPVDQPDYSPREGEVRYLNLLRNCTGMTSSSCTDNADCPSAETCEVVTECVSSSAWGFTYPCASVGCTPEFVDWAGLFAGTTLQVSGNAIIPDSTYTMSQLAASCEGNEDTCTDASGEVPFATTRYGDTEPNDAVNVTDVVNTVDVVKQLSVSLWEYQVYVRSPNPAPHLDATNVTDIVLHVDALKLVSYVLPLNSCP